MRHILSMTQSCDYEADHTIAFRHCWLCVTNWVRCWRGCLFGARCKWFAYGPADSTATPLSLALLESGMVSPFWCQLTKVVMEKRPLSLPVCHNCDWLMVEVACMAKVM